MMKELITLQQANMLMLAFLVIAPVIGAIWGATVKRLAAGLGWGIGIGAGNFVLWKVYNGITDRLGLDTVENLLVNLGLFIVIGVVGGIVFAMYENRAVSRTQAGLDKYPSKVDASKTSLSK